MFVYAELEVDKSLEYNNHHLTLDAQREAHSDSQVFEGHQHVRVGGTQVYLLAAYLQCVHISSWYFQAHCGKRPQGGALYSVMMDVGRSQDKTGCKDSRV